MTNNILFVSPTPSHPQNAGNRARIFRLASAVESLGYRVCFLYVRLEPGGDETVMHQYWGDRYISVPSGSLPDRARMKLLQLRQWLHLRRNLPFSFSIDAWYPRSLDHVLTNLSLKLQFSAVIVEYVFLSKALDVFGPETLKFIDTHDVFSLRHELYLNHALRPYWFSTSPDQETRGLNRADVVIAINDADRATFAGRVNSRVLTVGHIAPLFPPVPTSGSPNKLLFVGSANPVNVQGLQTFLKETLPLIRRKIPDVQVLIAGQVGKKIIEAESCLRLGAVDDLRMVYQKADVIINPVLFGTGTSIKLVEAMGHARPVVTTTAGARSLEEAAGHAFLVADSPAAFADQVVRVLTEPRLSKQLCQQAYQFARSWNEKNLRTLKEALIEGPGEPLPAQPAQGSTGV